MILIIAEKHQAAQRIAESLADGKVETLEHQKHPYFKISWNGKETVVVPLRGHIMTYDYSEKYNKWGSITPKELIDVKPEKVTSEPQIVKLIQEFKPEMVIHACDADPEGENIGFEALDLVKAKARRAWFSALTKEELREAFSKLRDPDPNLSASIDARMQIDLMFGAVLTREITLAVKRRQPISVGRCQTPTLKFLVDKELEVKKFISKKYWELIALLEKDKVKFEAIHKEGRFFEKEKAEKCLKKGEPKVISVKSSQESVVPPIPLNTTLLLRALNAYFNISASMSMRLAEQLYLAGYITYPRTDTDIYPKGVHEKLLKALKNSEYKDYANQLLSKGFKVNDGKKDAHDHPPVMPTTEIPQSLTGGLQKVYDFIVRHYLATLSPAAETINTNVGIDIAGEPYVSNGTIIKFPGFFEIYPFKKLKIVELPPLKQGDQPKLLSLDMKEGETKPPPRYSEGTLLKLMEKEGIGTKSTRQEHIETLKRRGYVEAQGKTLVVNLLGINLIEGLNHSAERITLPDFTRTLETEMELVAKGDKKVPEVVDEARVELRQMIDMMQDKKEDLAKTLRQAMYADRHKVIGPCPRCSKDLVIRFSKKAKKRFVGCTGYPNCTQTYSLPQKGLLSAANKICEKCKTSIVKIKTGRFSYDTCLDPKCEESIWSKMSKLPPKEKKTAPASAPKEVAPKTRAARAKTPASPATPRPNEGKVVRVGGKKSISKKTE